MESYKDTSFDSRAGQAADAKKKALDQLRTRPPLSEEEVVARKQQGQRREIAKAGKAAAKKAEKAAAIAAATAAASRPVPPTEAERKAARDARYAARKSRK